LADLTKGKEIIASAMTQEVERVKLALAKAREGKKVCLISSGDSGVYGMSGLVLELLNPELEDKVEIEIIPGVMSALGCAAILGAPLMHDFAVISLSDLLTDLKLIEERVSAAAKADFVIALYNPKSKKRIGPFERVWNILMKHRNPKTPVGIVRDCERDGQQAAIIVLKDMLKFKDIDMATTIIVGNSQTYVSGRYMITPRGYRI
jgi:precorrin-3B C17-methyltransferase